MTISDRLTDRLDDLFEASEREHGTRHGAAGRPVAPRETAQEEWIRNVILPKLSILAETFPNGTPPSRHGSHDHASVAFLPTPEGLLQAVVSVGVTVRPTDGSIQVVFRACAITELPPSAQERRITLPAGSAALRHLNLFLDDCIVEFAHHYLRTRAGVPLASRRGRSD